MLMPRSLFLMFPLLLIVSGCSDLILRDSDSAGTTTGKVMTRVLLCPITVCFSELSLAIDKRDEERAAQQAAYWQWVQSLPPEQQAREYALEEARIRAAGYALMGLGMGGGIIKPASADADLSANSDTHNPAECAAVLYQSAHGADDLHGLLLMRMTTYGLHKGLQPI